MKYITLTEQDKYPVAFLVKDTCLDKNELKKYYKNEEAIFIGIGSQQKTNAKMVNIWWENNVEYLIEFGIEYLYVADASFFKILTKVPKLEGFFGEVLPCKLNQRADFKVVAGVNYQALTYNPNLQEKLELSLIALDNAVQGKESGFVETKKKKYFPASVKEIQEALVLLQKKEALTCDIEAFSLNPYQAGIGSIAFAWNQEEGLAFPVDLSSESKEIRRMLKGFFDRYKGKLIWHNAAYDVKVKIASLYMEHSQDYEGMLAGLHSFTKKWDDTKIIAYLALNSTSEYSLKLKDLALPFAGNYALDVSDIRKIPLQNLLEYNLKDTFSTWYVYNKYYPLMVRDQQEKLYKDLMMPSQKLIIQLELIGLPLNMDRVLKVEKELTEIREKALKVFNSPLFDRFNRQLQTEAMEQANTKLKKLQHPLEKFANVVYNPNSGKQTAKLLFDFLGLPFVGWTPTGNPTTGADSLEKLLNKDLNQEQREVVQALIDFHKVDKILGTFISAFKKAQSKGDWHWLLGSFNLGGTVSGRLSSSNPNLQNLPSGSEYGKLIKTCFSAPKGWIFAGADFASLEDYISALTTKDPNKLNVYLKGFDGHCLRAAYYFKDTLSHIDLNDPVSVNSIKKTHPELRQRSKGPTFALTYAGTWSTLVNNLGWDEETAKEVEKAYHDMYSVSDEYVQKRLAQACKNGYVTVAFGLRLRTPLLQKTIWNSSKKNIPAMTLAESRTAGNALGQSYGLLNNRAAVAFMQKVWDSPFRTRILPVALIHDAIYIVMEDDIDVVEFANRELIKAMQWQELPEIQHDEVKLQAALDLFYPDWSNPITLPNNATSKDIIQTTEKSLRSNQ